MKHLMLATAATMALVAPLAGTALAQTKTIQGDMKVITATIEAIERSSRVVTLKEENGEYKNVEVPKEATKFDAMKVGDKITVKIYDNIVLRVKAPGEKAVDTDTAGLAGSSSAKPGITASSQRTITVTITAIDPKIPSITFNGPNGYKYSSRVEDKEALKKVKVGDRLDITWTNAMLVSVEAPAPAKK